MLRGQIKKYSSTINDVRSLFKLKLSLNNIGTEWELKINKTSSVNFLSGALLSTNTDGFSFSNFSAKWTISPDIYAEYRNYYNLSRRHKQQKKTLNNSANFLFARVESLLPVKDQNFFNLLFIQGWGAQRSLNNRITIDWHLGITEHFYFDKPPDGGFNYIFIEPFLAASLNYVF